MPDLSIARVECWVFRSPIESPVRTSFGTMTSRPAVFLRVSAADGAWGWGEVFCNFPRHGAEHRARIVESHVAPLLEGVPSGDPPAVRDRLEGALRLLVIQCGEPGPFAQAVAAVDQALWDMAARRAGVPLWQLLAGPGGSGRVQVYASGIGPAEVGATALRARAEGFRAFKFKVGFGPERDRANFAEIRGALGKDAVIMADANQAWSPEDALLRIEELLPFGPHWVEEPIAADEPLSRWHDLARSCGVPLAAGENLRGLEAFGEFLTGGIVSFIQPDVAKWGGVTGCRDVARLAMRHGVACCPHWLGGGIGLAVSLQLRAALGAEGYAEVDVNPNPLREEVCAIRPEDGWVTLPGAAGIGVEPELARLDRYRTRSG